MTSIPFTREEIGLKVMEVSQAVAEGYKGNRPCAIAASNTGTLILQALGFSHLEIHRIYREYLND